MYRNICFWCVRHCVCVCLQVRPNASQRAHPYFTADCHCIEFILFLFGESFVRSFVPLANKSDSFVTHYSLSLFRLVRFAAFIIELLFFHKFLFRLVRFKETHINNKAKWEEFTIFVYYYITGFVCSMHRTHGIGLRAEHLMWPSRQMISKIYVLFIIIRINGSGAGCWVQGACERQ